MRSVTFVLCFAVVPLLAVSGGCTKENAIPTSGVVTLDGTPVAEANVNFMPAGGGSAAQQPAHAVTNANGEFKMETHSDQGVFRGAYHVVVLKYAPLPGGGRGEQHNTLPRLYETSEQTPLKITVPHEGELRLELKSKP